MFKIRIYQGCHPEGDYVELEVSFDLFPKFAFQAAYQGHCVCIVDLTDNESYFIKTPEL